MSKGSSSFIADETDAAAPTVNNNLFKKTTEEYDEDNVFADSLETGSSGVGRRQRTEASPLRTGGSEMAGGGGKCWPEERQLELTARCLDNSVRAGLYTAEEDRTAADDEEAAEQRRERRRVVAKIVTLLCLAG
jgi:hypothetical protein